MKAKRGKKQLDIALGVILAVLTFRKKKPDSHLMRQMEFSHSTRRIGLRFTEKLRDLWRRRWLKLPR